MQKPPLDPNVDDTAPTDAALTVYDEHHIISYLRLLDADAARADWRKVARIVLHIDLIVNLIVHDMLSIVTWPAPNG